MIYWRSIMLVFLGACSYGILSTFVKFAYKAGFSPGEVSGSQMFLAALLMWVLALLVSRERATAKQWLLLVGVGATTGLTGVFYYRALQYVPASIAIVLLFQFTWIGVLVEAVLLRRRPETGKVIALILLLLGTVLAGGLFGSGFGQFTLAGVLLGLLSAVTYALFIIFSGRVAPQVNPWLRSAIMLTGASLLTFIVYPPPSLQMAPSGMDCSGGGAYSLCLAALSRRYSLLSEYHISEAGLPRFSEQLNCRQLCFFPALF